MNWKLLSITFLIILSGHTQASWSCFGLFKKQLSPRTITSLAEQRVEILSKINIGDKVSIQIKNKKFVGEVKNLKFQEIYLSSIENGDLIVKISKIQNSDDVHIIQRTSKQYTNRFKDFIKSKKNEASYLENSIELKEDFSSFSILSTEEQTLFNKRYARQIEINIKEKYFTEDIGFHFNLNGGQAIDYVNLGGIRASRGGDVAIQYGDRHAVISPQVYFFRANGKVSLYEIISQGNMKRIRQNSGRMGSVLNLFKADSEFFQSGLRSGGIKDNGLSYLYSEKWLC